MALAVALLFAVVEDDRVPEGAVVVRWLCAWENFDFLRAALPLIVISVWEDGIEPGTNSGMGLVGMDDTEEEEAEKEEFELRDEQEEESEEGMETGDCTEYRTGYPSLGIGIGICWGGWGDCSW
jgi:hypothetical protein